MAEAVAYKNYRGYQGNQNLKRSNVGVEWTEDMVSEYLKCSEDPIYFIETYMKVINVDEGLIPLKLRPYQKKMIISMHENRYTIIATARQAGKSTTTCAFILWYIIFNADKTVALLANKGATAIEILSKIQLAYEHLPNWLQQGVTEWNKGSFELENNSRVIASATGAGAIRGYSVNLLFIDEAAHIEDWANFFTSVFPTISSGTTTKIVLVSTPKGLNHFYKLWIDATEHRNSYNPICVMWYDVPGRDEAWKTEMLTIMSQEDFEQEHCVEFLGSSGTLIAGWKLKELVHNSPMAINSGVAQYVNSEAAHSYVTICDVSRGKGLDYSAFSIIDVSCMPYVQVCTYRSNLVSPVEYAEIICRMSKLYNNSSVLVETNDIGAQVADTIHTEYEYENLLTTQNNGRGGKRISAGFGNVSERGVKTTKTVKNTGCSFLKLLVEQNQLILKDYNTIQELSTFSRKNSTYEAESGSTDDLAMGLVLFAWLTNQEFFKEFTDINTITKLREKSEEDLIEELVPFGVINSGHDDTEFVELDIGGDSWMSSYIDF